MADKHSWTESKVAELETTRLQQLMINARSKGVADLASLCEAELKKRSTVSPSPRKVRSNSLRNHEDQIAAEIGDFAQSLAQEYDLSAETASRLSRGFKGFRPHTLTSKRGDAKLGGHQRTGKCELDRYVSYRIGNHYVSLGAWLGKGRTPQEVEYQVFGTVALLPTGVSPAQLRPNLPEKDAEGTDRRGVSFSDLDSAKTEFARLISLIAPRRD
jgi:hypothetical protein